MGTLSHYPNAPITEAIIDLRVQLAEEIDDARLKLVGEVENAAYPKQEKIVAAVGQVAVSPEGGSASVRQEAIGWKFSSEDQKQIFQVRNNGFAFSRLAPYDRWDFFRDEAKRLWTYYRGQVNPDSVVRLAVRYINRIDIPGDSVELKTYFRTAPEVAPELPQQLDGYFMQLRLPFPDILGHCLINQTIVPPPREGVVSVVLDIDLFRAEDVPQEEDSIWEYFERLHEEKNRIFESCITDPTRRLFVCQS